MINLNLLPPSLQARVRQQATESSLQSIAILVIVLTTLCAAVIGGGQWWLSYTTTHAEQQIEALNNSQGGQGQSLEQAVDSVNQKAAFLARAQAKDPGWADRLVRLTKITPSGITLASLSLDVTKNSMTLSGIAGTRDVLITYTDAIKELDFIDTAELPITSLSQQRDISFTISAKLVTP